MRRGALALVFSVLIAACGGGGGPVGDASDSADLDPGMGGGEFPPAPPPAATVDDAREVLADCAGPDVLQLLDLLDLLKGLASAGEVPPGFEVSDISVLKASASFSWDRDGVAPPEATGTVQSVDENGQPSLPVGARELFELIQDFDDLFGFFAKFEDGTTILIDFQYTEGEPVTGHLEIVFEGGLPDSASGELRLASGGCQGVLSFDDVGEEVWAGTYPVCVVGLDYETAAHHLTGTATLNGTRTALLVVTLDGVTTWTFEMDLETGFLTLVP